MKKRLPALLLALALPLSGCASMLERGYVSSTPHMDYSVTEDASILRAETYQGLVNSVLYFADAHEETGTIRLYNYTGDVEADLANACDEVLHEDPLGAYAIRSIQYDSTRILTYYEVELRIVYARTAAEVDAIREVSGVSGIRQELTRMVAERQEECVFLASYFSGDQTLVETLLLLALMDQPALCQTPGGLADYSWYIRFYPETGTRRVVQVKVPWSRQRTAQESADYVKALEEAAARLLEADPPSGDSYTVDELAAIVRAASGPVEAQGSTLALAALTGGTVNETARLLALEYLCQQSGIEAEMASGSGGLWLIVSTPEGYRHLLSLALPEPDPEAAEPPSDDGAEGLSLYTDEELSALGYTWTGGLYPACVDYSSEEDQAESL